jgi:hypothetical protein
MSLLSGPKRKFMLTAGNKKRQVNCRFFGVSIISGLASQHKIFEKTLSYVACLYL